MTVENFCKPWIFFFFIPSFTFIIVPHPAKAQIKLKGVVRDQSTIFSLSSVSVLTNSGNSTLTDTMGHFEIEVAVNDSIWFSYLNKPTKKYSVNDISDPSHFDVALLATVSLPEVKVTPRNYKMDSIQTRIDYAKAFNYEKPTFRSVVPSFGFPFFVMDIDEFIRAFQYRKKFLALDFKKRLIDQEKQKFIDNRFSKSLVIRITGLTCDSLAHFMTIYRPDYEFTKTASDYDFNLYIKNSFGKFIALNSGTKCEKISTNRGKAF
jgi:hypothetical protein